MSRSRSGALLLPQRDGVLTAYSLSGSKVPEGRRSRPASRRLIAAAHVVADPLRADGSGSPPGIDWSATLAYRQYLWSCGLAVAEAMDTAQRGMGLDWATASELIAKTQSCADGPDLLVSGAGTDQVAAGTARDAAEVVHAYQEQCDFIEGLGGSVVLMASRELARVAKSADDYLEVYSQVLTGLQRPAIIHWLGPMFDPQLTGYWGSENDAIAMETVLAVLSTHRDKVDGIKVSLLDAELEKTLRKRLPAGVRMYTGDDFGFAELIRGDGEQHSDALLGILDAIAPVAADAVAALEAGRYDEYERLLAPTVPLSRCIFEAPTRYYKTGVVFLAYINGYQSHFRMLSGLESARSILHFAEVFRLADQAGLIRDPDLAAHRMQHVLALSGLE